MLKLGTFDILEEQLSIPIEEILNSHSAVVWMAAEQFFSEAMVELSVGVR